MKDMTPEIEELYRKIEELTRRVIRERFADDEYDQQWIAIAASLYVQAKKVTNVNNSFEEECVDGAKKLLDIFVRKSQERRREKYGDRDILAEDRGIRSMRG